MNNYGSKIKGNTDISTYGWCPCQGSCTLSCSGSCRGGCDSGCLSGCSAQTNNHPDFT